MESNERNERRKGGKKEREKVGGRERGRKKERERNKKRGHFEFGKSSELVRLVISNIWSAQLLGHSRQKTYFRVDEPAYDPSSATFQLCDLGQAS